MPATSTNPTCPVCNSTRVATKSCPFPGLFECRACGFTFATASEDSSAADLYEQDWSKTEIHPTYAWSNGHYHIRNEDKLLILLKRLERFRQLNRILDVGCSAAFFLKLAKDGGWQPQGVEVSSFGANFSRDELGIPVFQGLLAEAAFPANSFDVACSSHVIEHIQQPLPFLKEMSRVLRPGGALVTVLPTQFAAPCYRFFGKWTGESPPRHVSFFNKASFEGTLRRLGYSISYSRQQVELQKITNALRPGTAAPDRAADDPNSRAATATVSAARNPVIRIGKDTINRIATGLGLGDWLTTIAVKPS